MRVPFRDHQQYNEKVTVLSPRTIVSEVSPSSVPLRKVSKLVDNYMAEVASEVNLKPEKMKSLAEILPDSARSLNNGLYRALDVYFKPRWVDAQHQTFTCQCFRQVSRHHIQVEVVLMFLGSRISNNPFFIRSNSGIAGT
ncbi:BTB/POZ domain-containing protein At3g44820-like isoform X2 [Helianthus annuus]|uniref:BTB/POZ domain-containing protein At3g44820-like isoform X2 n=1 Tax=Helianthus annuus TaxID=4232 RepID=UPI000B8F356D|nr:BTB/POZ domain-containing protein At3g44820-like isoform X2 [Helianthus annuus]